MIRLNRIYTRTGDDGSTMLGDGSRTPKNSARVEAFGEVDELNSFLGVAIALTEPGPLRRQLQAIQNTLFDVSSDLCVPLPPAGSKPSGGGARTPLPAAAATKVSKSTRSAKVAGAKAPAAPVAPASTAGSAGRLARQQNHPRLPDTRATELEKWIDAYNLHLKPLDSFILPGGTALAAALHVARCVCRRAERRVLTLSQEEPINPAVLQYVNRLSDYLFVVARAANALTGGDIKWKPGK